MTHRTLIVFTAVTLLGLSFANAQAGPNARFNPETMELRPLTTKNILYGYRAFQQNCKSCHSRDNDKEARFLYAGAKGMQAWNRVFYTRYPVCAKNGSWDTLSPEKLMQLNDYLVFNAWDAEDPNVCA